MRRIDDLGRVTIYSALVGSIVGLAAIWFYGVIGVVWFVIAQPLAVVIIAFQYTSRLPQLKENILNVSAFWQEWKPMAKLGTAFMLGGLATTITLLLVRRSITQEIGLEAAGLFAAAWSISMIYVGLMLGAEVNLVSHPSVGCLLGLVAGLTRRLLLYSRRPFFGIGGAKVDASL